MSTSNDWPVATALTDAEFFLGQTTGPLNKTITPLNALRIGIASILTQAGVGSQALTADTPTFFTQFTSVGAVQGCTGDSSADTVTATNAGTYWCELLLMSWTGTASTQHKFELWAGTSGATTASGFEGSAETDSNGAGQPISVGGYITLAAAGNIEVKVESIGGTSTFVVVEAVMRMQRVY